jgi:hypothetical protein
MHCAGITALRYPKYEIIDYNFAGIMYV